MGKLDLDWGLVKEARESAKKIAADSQVFIDAHSTVTVERTICRLLGIDGVDEFARGTNPKEGQKFVRALAKYLNEKPSISIITTHFDSVVESNMKHYQVVGLKNLDFENLKNRLKANNSLELIQDNMDFTLEESIETEVPKDALNIAKLIGLDDEISEMIYREYEWEEQ